MNSPADFNKLVLIMDELREKCPWDKKQTIHSLRQQTIEETYELADAITNNNWNDIKEELGDLLLHVIFYAKIASELKQFSLQDIIDTISEKLIRRHPHIYSDTVVSNDEDVKRNWEQIKLKEGKKSVLSGVPHALPSLIKAMRIQEKAKQVGFEWNNKEEVWDKVIEEQNELIEAVTSKDQACIEEEFGDLLFSLVNYSRFINVDVENALELTNKKFIRRFTLMEEAASKNGIKLQDLSLQEMEELWISAKNNKS